MRGPLLNLPAVGRPVEVPAAQPSGREATAAMGGEDFLDRGLIGLRRCGGEGERDFREPKVEQAIAAARLAVIFALRRRAAKNLDLAIIETEAPVDRRDLRLRRALIRQQNPCRAAFDDGGRDGAAVDVGERLCGEDDRGVLLPERLQPLAKLKPGSSSASQPSSTMSKVGRPSKRSSMRWKR
jgi:hypothetical protein